MSTFNLYELKKWKDSDSWYDSIISLGKFAMDDNFHRSYRWLNRILSQKWLFINNEFFNIRLSSKEIETKFFSLSHHRQYFLH